MRCDLCDQPAARLAETKSLLNSLTVHRICAGCLPTAAELLATEGWLLLRPYGDEGGESFYFAPRPQPSVLPFSPR